MSQKQLYFVRGFDVARTHSSVLLLAPAISMRIRDQSILIRLESLKAHRLTYVDENSEIVKQLTSDPGLVAFLQNQAGILVDVTEISGENARFKSVKLYTDRPGDAERWMEYLHREGCPPVEISGCESFDSARASKSTDCLFVVLLADYDASFISAIYDAMDVRERHGALTSYVYGNQFWIDGLFMKSAGLPSHFSHVEKWRSLEYGNKKAGSGWPALLDFFAAEHCAYQNPYAVSDVELSVAVFHLLQRVVELTGVPRRGVHLDDLLSAIRIDISTGVACREIAVEWQPDPTRGDAR
ncbi:MULTISPECIES: McbB family protein [unclassified Achromobacter]|uniref:McbB family protein n=1 Tax=unclassified Achromobacter TaxID=2626865 RepID=UPI000B515D37|nr:MULTISPECIES: McbB family protein [unclassified Achromobacter]OWT74552.1 hypothetical protein CEY05_18280 [Achromobacter sp. HZ34]OWT79019.1 hypothetical protein CEY04_08200 [Achromobacter sp. HZ28]